MTKLDSCLDALWNAGQAAIKEAQHCHEMIDLAGMHYHNEHDSTCEDPDCCGPDPYVEIENMLKLLLRDNMRMKTHRHKWDSDHRCSICGADGLA